MLKMTEAGMSRAGLVSSHRSAHGFPPDAYAPCSAYENDGHSRVLCEGGVFTE